MNIWQAAATGNVGEVGRLVGEDPDLLDRKMERGYTPLIIASHAGHMEVVRWLVDHGAAINERDNGGHTALLSACVIGRTPVVRLLVEGGADPTLGDANGRTPLIVASARGHPEVVRCLLGNPSARETMNNRVLGGATELWEACFCGRGGGREGAARERGRPNHRHP
jgi:uncharacterized protein